MRSCFAFLLIVSLYGCAERRPPDSTEGGAGGNGQGGAAGSGGVSAAGSGGTSGDSGNPSSDAAPFDGGPACGDSAGPTNTWMTPRHVIPWKLVPASAKAGDGGVSAVDGGADAGWASSCSSPSAFSASVRCSGVARVRSSAAALRLQFADGSALEWNAIAVQPAVSKPAVADGDSVFVDYVHDVGVECPVCGTYYDDSLVIRRDRQGTLLWFGMEGHQLGAPDPAVVRELFGADAVERRACRHVERDMCTETVTEVFDQVIETTPEQIVHLGEVAHVATPLGEYDVVWAHTTETTSPRPGCPPPQPVLDGPGPAWDRAFAVSRTR